MSEGKHDGGESRFVVRELEGYAMTHGRYLSPRHLPMLSISVLDSADCYRELARFNEEDVRTARNRTKADIREALRNRAAGFVAMLEADA